MAGWEHYRGIVIGSIVGGIFGLVLILGVSLYIREMRKGRKKTQTSDIELAGVVQPDSDATNGGPAVPVPTRRATDPALPSYETDETPSLFKIVASIAVYQRASLDVAALHLLLAERIVKLESMVTDLDILLVSSPVEGFHPESAEAKDMDNLRISVLALIGAEDDKPLPRPRSKALNSTSEAKFDTDAWHGRLLGIASFATTFTTTISHRGVPDYTATLQDFVTSLRELRIAVGEPSSAGATGSD